MSQPIEIEAIEGDDYGPEDEGEQIYGFPLVTNPHDFSPDMECCSPEEIANWEADKALYGSGKEVPNPREGSGWYRDESGNRSFHLLTTRWGIGVSFIRPDTVSPEFDS